MSKYSRSGGKFTGNHTTFIPAAALVADIANACSAVYRISPGFINAGLKSANGQRRVKILKGDDGKYILLSVRDNASQQEVHVYASETHDAMHAIAKGARNAGLAIAFK
jgi:hypothetical protein